MPNQISKAGLRFIQNFEGCRLTAYKPVAAEKYWTIGYGHYGPDVKQGQKITQKQADDMFYNDMQSYVAGVNALVHVPINQNQFDALVSFAYNVGVGGLQRSSLLLFVNLGSFMAAADEFPKWCHGAGGVMLQGLLNRRNKERAVFLTPVVTTPVIGGDDDMKLTDKEVDVILKALSFQWGQTKNKIDQGVIHAVADRVREESGRPKQ
ncbi:lysozyme [Paenibacillus sp. OV219]|uniref:lysozyme n=1 Tax=Paenibacillus sp. OV219 TaxID=1884377 RepID=UPI0008C11D49|nr:lysozyme [Paenibacillus sp. OV219]SEN19899.1 Phage-related lysozyme (muramidase), GH24 family [Paenibacillus sp. OV219]